VNFIEAIFLGIIQGLTEFLPISSTGHLTLTGKLMGVITEAHPERWTAFIAVIQLGTLLAVIVYFRKDLVLIVRAFLKENIFERKNFTGQSLNSKLGWYIIIGSIPVAVIGLGFKDAIEGTFTKNLYVIAGSLITLGIILGIAEKAGNFKKNLSGINWFSAFLIGLAQSFALIPGSSRSGTTITMALFLGFERETAARFSFLLSIPAVFGSGLLEFYQSLSYINYSNGFNLLLATLFSFISGYFAIGFLLKYLKTNSTYIFVFYRILIGAVIFALLYFGTITP